jgi:septum formation protein
MTQSCNYLERLESKYEIILASGSIRRQQMLRDLGIKFSICDSLDVDETAPSDLNYLEVAKHIAHKKAKAYKPQLKNNQLIITCDTIVVHQGDILGKPANQQDAYNYLKKLSGGMHEVITGVCLMTKEQTKVFHAQTLVWFERLTDDEIDFYIDNFKPFDKAGAYGIQEWIGMVGIWRIEGSYFNVVGMPIQLIYRELQDFL